MNDNRTAACVNCGRKFARRRVGHVFCSARCRHQAGRVPPDEQAPAPDPEVVVRLFDPRRDPEERVRDDDWYPGSPAMQELYAWDTVGKRRRWFRELQRLGRLAR